MSVQVTTSALRSAASRYDETASSCLDVAHRTSSGTKELAGAILDPAVSGAVSAALVAVLRDLQLVGGAFSYSSSSLHGCADSYDAADDAVATHMHGMIRAS